MEDAVQFEITLIQCFKIRTDPAGWLANRRVQRFMHAIGPDMQLTC